MKKVIFCNLANVITSIGIILTVWIIGMLWWNRDSEYRFLIFLFAIGVAVSDLLDGWLARRYKIVTPLGGFLDKFRDKIFASFVFVYFLIELWFWANEVLLIFIKSLIILILGTELFLVIIWIVGIVRNFNTASHLAGKVKMAFYFIAIAWWFFLDWLGNLSGRKFDSLLYWGLIILLFAASICGILSVVGYIQRYNSKHK
jgi:phosphatidylglycerophosphate synthase